MLVEIIKNDTTTILQLSGRLDDRMADDFLKSVTEILKDAPDQLILDLGSVDYVGSAGLRVLIRAAKEARAVSARLALCALRPNVMEVVHISGLTKIFSIYTDRSLTV